MIGVVEEVDAHGVDGEHVDREPDAFGHARRGVAVAVRAQRGYAALGKVAGRGVALPHDDALLCLGSLEVLRKSSAALTATRWPGGLVIV
jgi:hypothetical protein